MTASREAPVTGDGIFAGNGVSSLSVSAWLARENVEMSIISQAFLVRGAGLKRMRAIKNRVTRVFPCFMYFRPASIVQYRTQLTHRSQHLASSHRGQSSTRHRTMESSRVSLSFVAVLISVLAHPTCVDGFFVPAPACRPTASGLQGSQATGINALSSRSQPAPRRMHEVWRRQASMSARQPGDGAPTG